MGLHSDDVPDDFELPAADSKLGAGLIAFGIVAGLMLLLVASLFVASRGSKVGAQSAGGPVAGRSVAVVGGVQPKPDVAKIPTSVEGIVSHPWWKRKPTAAKVEEWIAKIMAMNARSALWIDDEGKEHFMKALPGEMVPGHYGKLRFLNPRQFYVFIDPKFFSNRLNREEAIERLKSSLDYEDFRD